MTTTEITADQVKPGDTITALFIGIQHTGLVRSVDPAVFTTRRTGVEHVLITLKGGTYWRGQDSSVSIPASQTVIRTVF